MATGEETTSSPRASSRTESGRNRAPWPSASRSWVRTTSGKREPDTCNVLPADSRSHREASFRIGQSPSASSDDAATTAESPLRRTSRTLAGLPIRASTAEMAASLTWSRPAAATSSTPAPRSASSRVAVLSSLRTRPAIRLTTSRKSTADATTSTRTSGLSICWAKRMQGAIRHAPREEPEAHRCQARARSERRLLERPHGGVQGGRTPEQVVGDPADVVDQLVVAVRALEQGEVVGRVRGEEADDAPDEQVEGRRALARVDREPDRGPEQEDVPEGIRHRHGFREPGDRLS